MVKYRPLKHMLIQPWRKGCMLGVTVLHCLCFVCSSAITSAQKPLPTSDGLFPNTYTSPLGSLGKRAKEDENLV
ncbi:hypothetical protein F4808DRAFT_422820 [Astrocystis sublimbata]|nr:hypothetical protein F4808DRAFT_422820 [Astrocystis sublimbata]